MSKATLCLWDMYPRKEKTTNPEKKLVKELMELVMIASLGQDLKKKKKKHTEIKCSQWESDRLMELSKAETLPGSQHSSKRWEN